MSSLIVNLEARCEHLMVDAHGDGGQSEVRTSVLCLPIRIRLILGTRKLLDLGLDLFLHDHMVTKLT